MGRKKLIDYFKVSRGNGKKIEPYTQQERFQQYLEERVLMTYNYIKTWWGVKPHGLLNTIDLADINTSWGKHYILNIVVPYDIPYYGKVERAIVKYVLGVFPLPDLVNIKIYEGLQFNREADVIIIEAKQVLISVFD